MKEQEENNVLDPAAGASALGKFKDAEALMRAYRELEAEFTRRSQRLKALEEAARTGGEASAPQAPQEGGGAEDGEALYAAAVQNEAVRKRIVGDYLESLRGVPLMAGGGAPVRAPARRISSIGEAGTLALGYLRNHKS